MYLKLLFKPDGLCNKGDINHDGSINVTDIVSTVNIILEITVEVTAYELWAGDYNSDSDINITDIVNIVNL